MKSHRPAFSLVELLVVIGIIGLLISLFLPSLTRAREAATRLQCSSQLRQIGQGIFAYATANRGYLPMASGIHNYPNDFNTTDPNGPGWIVGIARYVGAQPDSRVYSCPAFAYDTHPVTYFLECRWMRLHDPSIHTFPMSTIKFSSMFILSGDCTGMHFYNPPFGDRPEDFDDIDKDDSLDMGPEWRTLIFLGEDEGYNMHRAGNNILFADGHVQVFKQFDRTSMTYSPHQVQDWIEVTPD